MGSSVVLFTLFLALLPFSFGFSRGISIQSRIIGGNVASPGQFPYQAGLQLKVANITELGTCGGSLISSTYVLTAAHCVNVPRIEHIEVHLGAHELKNLNEGHLVVIVPKQNFIPHKEYNEALIHFDIALLKLPATVQFTDKIQPIALPSRSDEKLKLEDKFLTASGWGRYSDDLPNLSDFLRFTSVSVLNDKICKHYFNEYFLPSMICTYTGLGQGPCSSDSGGPLVYADEGAQRKVIIGVVSYGGFSCVKAGIPVVYTRVTSFLNWIAENSDIRIQD